MPTETIGRYEIESVIGRGAMAVVYKAVDPTIGRTVALKTMRVDVHGIEKNEVFSRFRNEARAAGKLLHPNLVTIYDAGEQEGVFYIAMECVEGSTLQNVLQEQRFLTLDRTVDVMSQICAGLDYAHSNNVIHRDIKPANIMLTRSGVVKIMDFGIAKSGAQLTTSGDVLGTPNYISPEMVKGDPIDGRSDLFSVAVILHEMLLGERPFLAPNISTIIYKIVNEPLSADLETKVHPAMAGILRKALAKHPSDRYQTGNDLVNALKSYQALLTQPIPRDVFPGTPINPGWNGSASSTGLGVAPKLADATPVASKSPEPAFEAPEVFGSDVPEVFRKIAPEPPKTEAALKSPLPPIDFNAPVPPRPAPRPVAASPGPLRPATDPPPVFGAEKLQSTPTPQTPAAKPGTKGGVPWVAIIGIVTAVIAMTVFGLVWRAKNNKPGPTVAAPLTVAVPDPVAILETEKAKAPEQTSKIEAGADERLGKTTDDAAAATGKKKNAKPAPVAVTVAPPPAPTAPAVVTASLAISSSPDGATVQLDGQNRGERTPFTASGLQPGTHTVIFTKQGYVPMTRTVEIAGGNNAALNVNLVVAPTQISFESTPEGASIFVDEEPTGQMTPSTIKLSPGKHAISIAKAGFEEGTGVVDLSEGETSHFATTLQPADRETHIKHVFAGAKDEGMIIVRTRPRGAHVKVNDADTSVVTPTRVIVHNGKVHLTIEKDGYKPFKKDLQVGKGDIIVVEAMMEKK